MLGIIATAPGQNFTVSLFVDAFIADFGLERTVVSGLFSLGTFIAALSLTWLGSGVDRFGNRFMNTVLGVLMALTLMLFATVGGPVGLFLGFLALRGLGQGGLWISSTTAIAQWFRSRRGRMTSLALAGFWLFQSVYVPFLQDLITAIGWRQVWVVLGLGTAVLIVPAMWLLMRDRPEQFGLTPDNLTQSATDALPEEDNWTLREAMHTTLFWIFTAGRLLVPAFISGVVFHQISIFAQVGHSPQVAADTYGIVALITALVTLVSGAIMDRFNPARAMALQLATAAITLFLAMHMEEGWMLLLFAVALGTTMGTGPVFDGTVWANLFGRRYQGAIRGFVASALVIGTAFGPIGYGLSYDLTGGYAPILTLGIILMGLMFILSFFAHKPEHHPA